MPETIPESFWKSDYHVGWATFWKRFVPHNNPEIPTAYELLNMLKYWDQFLTTPYLYQDKGIALRQAQQWVNLRTSWGIAYLKIAAEERGLNSLAIGRMHDALRPYGGQKLIRPVEEYEEPVRFLFSTRQFLSSAHLHFKTLPSERDEATINLGLDEIARLEVKFFGELRREQASQQAVVGNEIKPKESEAMQKDTPLKMLTREDILNTPDAPVGKRLRDMPVTDAMKAESEKATEFVLASKENARKFIEGYVAMMKNVANMPPNPPLPELAVLNRFEEILNQSNAAIANKLKEQFSEISKTAPYLIHSEAAAHALKCQQDFQSRMPLTSISMHPDFMSLSTVPRAKVAKNIVPSQEQMKRAILEALQEYERRKQESPAEPTKSADSSPAVSQAPNANQAIWMSIATQMLGMVEQGEKFTTQREMAKRLGVGTSTINKAIQSSRKLKDWSTKTPQTMKAIRLGPTNMQDIEQQSEADPTDMMPDDDVDLLMAELMASASPEEQKLLAAQTPEQRKRLAVVYEKQRKDLDPSELDETSRRQPRIHGRV